MPDDVHSALSQQAHIMRAFTLHITLGSTAMICCHEVHKECMPDGSPDTSAPWWSEPGSHSRVHVRLVAAESGEAGCAGREEA